MKLLDTIKHIPSIVTRGGGKAVFQLKQYSPEILLGVGLVGGVTATVLACRATNKVSLVMDDHENATTDIAWAENHALKNDDGESLHELKKEKTRLYLHTTTSIVKLYAPAVGFGAASIACILGSFGILKGRNAALMAAYSVLNDRFINYRQRVRNEFGEEKERDLYFGTHKETVEIDEVGKNGKIKKIKKELDVVNPHQLPPYAKIFDDSCENWSSDPDYNKLFLTRQQNWANDKLKRNGYLLLNEVYDMLGFPRTSTGCIVGWKYDPEDKDVDSYVDFGIFNVYNECSRDFVNGYESCILLDFNVDGVIYDQIDHIA